MVARDGTVVWVRDDAVFRTHLPGRADVMDGILTDVTELKMMEHRLRHLATHDHMTGLCNRHRFEEELEHQVAPHPAPRHPGRRDRARPRRREEVNDELGHHAGDVLLKLVASRMSERLRAVDVVGRLAATSSACCFPAWTRRAPAPWPTTWSARPRHPSGDGGPSVGTTASLGIAVLRADDYADAGGLRCSHRIAAASSRECPSTTSSS